MPRPKGGARLDRERIIQAALRVVDVEGLDALSMRRLGAELGVDPMSIYHHVPGKDALVRALVELVFGAMSVPPTGGDWREDVQRWAEAYRAVAVAHPNLVLAIVTDPAAVAVAAAHADEALYAALERSGLPRHEVPAAADTIVDYVNGSVLGLAAPPMTASDLAGAIEGALDALPAERTSVRRRFLHTEPMDEERRFRFGLELILAGLDARVGGEATARRLPRTRARGRPR